MTGDPDLPEPLSDDEIPDGWELSGYKDSETTRTYWNYDRGLYIYVYSDGALGETPWGINLERSDENENYGEKEQQVAATAVRDDAAGSADDAANLHAVVRGYMTLAERLDTE